MRRLRSTSFRFSSALAFALSLAFSFALMLGRAGEAQAQSAEVLSRARTLDEQGVALYREGHFRDAILYFRAALERGGPPSEIWNIAKCHLRLDEPEDAARAIERYLAASGLTAEDRAEATEQLAELRRRRSNLTVLSSPSGALVVLDGRRAEPLGVTPLTTSIAPGAHTIAVERAGGAETRSIEARYGRALIVEADVGRDGDAAVVVDGKPVGKVRRASIGVGFGGFLPHAGDVGEPARPALWMGGAYAVHVGTRATASIGARLQWTGDAWSNTVAAPTTAPGGCTLPHDFSATSLGAFVLGALDARLGAPWQAAGRWRVGGELGVGVVGLVASQAGGDVLDPSCDPHPGVVPAAHAAIDVSFAIVPQLRLVVQPLVLEANPAFAGARSTPRDASGIWWRIGAGLGLAVDL